MKQEKLYGVWITDLNGNNGRWMSDTNNNLSIWTTTSQTEAICACQSRSGYWNRNYEVKEVPAEELPKNEM